MKLRFYSLQKDANARGGGGDLQGAKHASPPTISTTEYVCGKFKNNIWRIEAMGNLGREGRKFDLDDRRRRVCSSNLTGKTERCVWLESSFVLENT